MATGTALAVNWVEQGMVPDRVVRLGIRRLLAARLVEVDDGHVEAEAYRTQAFVNGLAGAPRVAESAGDHLRRQPLRDRGPL